MTVGDDLAATGQLSWVGLNHVAHEGRPVASTQGRNRQHCMTRRPRHVDTVPWVLYSPVDVVATTVNALDQSGKGGKMVDGIESGAATRRDEPNLVTAEEYTDDVQWRIINMEPSPAYPSHNQCRHVMNEVVIHQSAACIRTIPPIPRIACLIQSGSREGPILSRPGDLEPSEQC